MSWEPQEGQTRMDVDVTVRGRGSGVRMSVTTGQARTWWWCASRATAILKGTAMSPGQARGLVAQGVRR
ncbi:hypothetical protein D5R93_09275 [Actinomyces lilanjuaniae]|uniref:Uncharacterized protein n=1 Tax=Actinomyces lilanjuaniae TaxID=2321394 RepID=A0ABM6Z4P8_9ACTO|nr:hypothetical protein [Actinomyces lilanjuaniae]AYD90143.1 hypothetical protein D5R93_09275 [Actinomyces lilanjuaniae]